MNSLVKAGKTLMVAGARGFAASHVPERKVVVLGAAGGIGQPLGLLMKVCSCAGRMHYSACSCTQCRGLIII